MALNASALADRQGSLAIPAQARRNGLRGQPQHSGIDIQQMTRHCDVGQPRALGAVRNWHPLESGDHYL